MNNSTEKDQYKTSRILYIIEAALEYFIALGIGGGYLAKLGLAIGMSESLIAIIGAFVSLGCGFQIISVFLINKTPVKPWITTLHIISQIFFAMIWFVPLFKTNDTAKIVLFITFILSAHVLHNVVNSPKQNWFMSLVDPRKRGLFTAIKEIVSLAGGMVFTLCYGKIIDHFTDNGQPAVAFVLCGSLLLFFMVGHTLTLLFSKEKRVETKSVSLKRDISAVLKNKILLPVILLPVLWNVINYSTMPFYAVYQASDLGFSALYIGVVSTAYSIVRAVFSVPMGRLADKTSFPVMMNVCFFIMAISYFINIFTVPENGHVLYLIAYCLFGAGMAGINSGIFNIFFQLFPSSQCTAAYAIKNTISGIAGFVTTLAFTPLVNHISNNGNTFLGLNVYAPQVLSAIAFVLVIVTLLYNKLVFCKLKKVDDTAPSEPENK